MENNDLNNINLDLRNIDFDRDTEFPEIEGLDDYLDFDEDESISMSDESTVIK